MCSKPTQMRRRASRGARGWGVCTIAVVALAIAGCGGSDNTSAGQTAASSISGPRARLIAQAEVICKRRDEALEAVPLSSAKSSAIARYATQSAALQASGLSELARLSAPGSMAQEWQQILTYTRGIRSEMVKLREDAKRGDTGSIDALSQATKAIKRKLQALASRAGFIACAQL